MHWVLNEHVKLVLCPKIHFKRWFFQNFIVVLKSILPIANLDLQSSVLQSPPHVAQVKDASLTQQIVHFHKFF